MTRDELNLKIVESFETRPVVGSDAQYYYCMNDFTSLRGYWQFHANQTYECCTPRDMLVDPAMTVLLLEKLLKADWLCGYIQYADLPSGGVYSMASPAAVDTIHDDFGWCVGLAYAKYKGLI